MTKKELPNYVIVIIVFAILAAIFHTIMIIYIHCCRDENAENGNIKRLFE